MASISDLEPEFVEFIQTQNYGTPKAFAKPHDYEDLKAYYEGLSGILFEIMHWLQFLKKMNFCCLFGKVNIFSWSKDFHLCLKLL